MEEPTEPKSPVVSTAVSLKNRCIVTLQPVNAWQHMIGRLGYVLRRRGTRATELK